MPDATNIDPQADAMDGAYQDGKEDLAAQLRELIYQLQNEEDIDKDEMLDWLLDFIEAELGAYLNDSDFDESDVEVINAA